MTEAEAHVMLAGRSIRLNSQTFHRLVILAVILGFGAVMIAAISAAWAVARDRALTAAVAHSTAIQHQIAELRVTLERTETARRGYLLTADPQNLTTYNAAAADAPKQVEAVAALTGDNASQGPRIDALRNGVKGQLASGRWSVDMVARGEAVAAVRAFQTDRSTENMRQVRALMAPIEAEERRLLDLRTAGQRQAARNLLLALAIAGPLLLIVAIGSTFVIFRYTRDLAQTGAALRTLNEGLESAVAQRTASLERANQEIQRFAYIVSHDLRSPLVNVMGFTSELETSLKPLGALVDRLEADAPDLLTSEAAVTVREEVPEALGFIRKSTQKMDRLINAILQLSRSGRRQLRPEALDLNRLLGDVASTLKTRADEAGAKIVIAPDLPGVISDRLAVEQVFANLMENAVKYLAPGRPGRIEITGERQAGHALISVVDNGRGIDPKDHQRIFELFRRAGAQDRPGEGIGLAAVQAAVHRLGGSISCDSALDQGAAFRVLLPAVLKVEQELYA